MSNESFVLTTDDIVYYSLYYSVLAVITAVVIGGNSLVLLAILRHSNLRVPTNGFIVSLSLSDLLNGFAYSTYQVSHMEIPALMNMLGTALVVSFQQILAQSEVAPRIVLSGLARLNKRDLIVPPPVVYHIIFSYALSCDTVHVAR
ncbi:hypothetical protein LSAT2_001703 [Lamellibrachia satsuma]|nr:hypothetical protein LSAT2_001703 [Lamellibrachia satsuma]